MFTKDKILKIFTIALFSLFFALPAFASVDEDFDSYTTGNIDDKSSDWIYDSGGHLQVSSGQSYSSPNSLLHNTNYNNGGTLYNPSGVDGLASVSFKFKFNVSGSSNDYLHIYGQNSGTYDTSIWTEDLFDLNLRRGVYTRFLGEDFASIISTSDTSWHNIALYTSSTPQYFKACIDSSCSSWKYTSLTDTWDSLGFNDNYHNLSYNQSFDDFVSVGSLPPFAITSPEMDEAVIDDSWITVEGVCPTNGTNRIGFTSDCLGFDDIQYTVDCVGGTFSGQFYKSGLSDRVIAREIDSVSGDCVDYDDLMDFIEVSGIEVIEGYPDDWYFDFDYYDDYDIRIHSPVFDTALTLPQGSTSTDFTFGFIYPSEQLANMNFNIKQYDSDGNLLNANYHNEDLSDMTDTWSYTVNLTASSTQGIHYVVQLTESGEMKRQYPFGIYVSDLDFVINPDDYEYFFPRLVEELKKKVIFNYYFAFHDGFYDMFNADYSQADDDALDLTFKSVSGDGEYNLDITVFSASDARVKSFASGLRPYIVALLWLLFALYVVFRITHLFSDNE